MARIGRAYPIAPIRTHTAGSTTPHVALAHKIASLSDAFNESVLNPTLWTSRYGSYSMTGTALDVSATSSYSGVGSANVYDLTSSVAAVTITPPGLGGGGRAIGMELALNQYGASGGSGGVGIEWGDYGGSSTLTAYYYASGSTNQTQIGYASVSATSPFGYRIRESAGTVYWDYSTDGINWSNFASLSDTTLGFAITQLYAVMFAGYYGTDSTFNALYSNFNGPGVAATQGQGVAVYRNVTRGASQTQGQSVQQSLSSGQVIQVTQAQAGKLVRADLRAVIAVQGQSPSIAAALTRALTGTQSQTQAVTRALFRTVNTTTQPQTVTQVLQLGANQLATQPQSVSVTYPKELLFLVTQGQVSTLLKSNKRMSTTNQGQSATIARAATRHLTSSQTQSSSVIAGRTYKQQLTTSQTQAVTFTYTQSAAATVWPTTTTGQALYGGVRQSAITAPAVRQGGVSRAGVGTATVIGWEP